jgi:hypothetical protein
VTTLYRANCTVTIAVLSDWVRAGSEAEATDKIMADMVDETRRVFGDSVKLVAAGSLQQVDIDE